MGWDYIAGRIMTSSHYKGKETAKSTRLVFPETKDESRQTCYGRANKVALYPGFLPD